MYTFLTYVFDDGTEARTYSEALRSGKHFKRRYRQYIYENPINPFKEDITGICFIEDDDLI